MKLRLDLLEQLTDQDILEEVLANNHRYKPEPLFSKTGVGLVIGLNRGACARGGAQHGFNRETQATCRREWEATQPQVLSLDETLAFLRQCHRRAPFLFINGNTFADIGRQIAADGRFLHRRREREMVSADLQAEFPRDRGYRAAVGMLVTKK
jgi:hypothetical protein